MKINPRIDIVTFYHVCLCCQKVITIIFLLIFIPILDDHSRIILKCCDKSIPGADYINANMIKVIFYFTFLKIGQK